mmetsp:Transcript_16309/g.40591  ORF Transcript_16309/g.40591 Transcript_16309/m.40591 type:complete len:353 (-) Transcript_16309:2357-3415(-)
MKGVCAASSASRGTRPLRPRPACPWRTRSACSLSSAMVVSSSMVDATMASWSLSRGASSSTTACAGSPCTRSWRRAYPLTCESRHARSSRSRSRRGPTRSGRYPMSRCCVSSPQRCLSTSSTTRHSAMRWLVVHSALTVSTQLLNSCSRMDCGEWLMTDTSRPATREAACCANSADSSPRRADGHCVTAPLAPSVPGVPCVSLPAPSRSLCGDALSAGAMCCSSLVRRDLPVCLPDSRSMRSSSALLRKRRKSRSYTCVLHARLRLARSTSSCSASGIPSGVAVGDEAAAACSDRVGSPLAAPETVVRGDITMGVGPGALLGPAAGPGAGCCMGFSPHTTGCVSQQLASLRS